MQHPVDLEGLSAALTDHPWLAEAIRNGAWWDAGEGRMDTVAPLNDPREVRAGLAALAAALGIEKEDLGPASGWRSQPVPAEMVTAVQRAAMT